MGVKLKRAKGGNTLVRTMYLFSRLLPLSKKGKLRLFLNMEWIFDKLSHEYSFKYYQAGEHPARQHTKQFLMPFILPGHSVLDLGCNDGVMANYISLKAKEVVGIDYDKKEIEAAKARYQRPNLLFLCEEGYAYLTSKGRKFDVLILSHVLEHLDDPDDFLKKFIHFFEFIYIEVPDFNNNLLNQYRQEMKLPLIYSDWDHIFEFDRTELQALLERNKLAVISSEFQFGVQKYWCRVVG